MHVHSADPAALEAFKALLAKFKAGFPDWEPRMLTPQESVEAMLSVIQNLEMKDSGKFLSHYGNETWLM